MAARIGLATGMRRGVRCWGSHGATSASRGETIRVTQSVTTYGEVKEPQTEAGKRVIAPTNFSRWWRSFMNAHGFGGLKFHELRHTQATQLVAGGVDMKTIQHQLDRASASLTMNLYAHALPENDAQAARLIGNLFSETPNEQARQNRALLVAV